MRYRWHFPPLDPKLTVELARTLRVSPLLGQCLLNRGLRQPEAAQAFLHPRLRDLSDPFLLPNMLAAVQRLFLARQRGEKILLFGDYDDFDVTGYAWLLPKLVVALGLVVAAFLERQGASVAAVFVVFVSLLVHAAWAEWDWRRNGTYFASTSSLQRL